MNKTELVAAMAKETNLSKKDVEAVLKSFIDVVSEELKKGEKVQLVGFGTFEVSERAAREGRNPRTGETMKIESSKAPKFKDGKDLKDRVIASDHRLLPFLGDFGLPFFTMKVPKSSCGSAIGEEQLTFLYDDVARRRHVRFERNRL